MREAKFVLMVASCLLFAACSSSGSGSGSPDDYGTEGNIPLGQSGGPLADVNFDYDSASISAAAQETLAKNAGWLAANSDVGVIIEGHCDERGTQEYNMALGLRRATAVKDYLRTLGTGSSQLKTVSYGEDVPLITGSSEAAWAANRRAHFAPE